MPELFEITIEPVADPAAEPRTAPDSAPAHDLVRARYGENVLAEPLCLDDAGVIRLLLQHRSVRAFGGDSVEPDVVDTIVAAAQSASTSSNLQTWSVVVVRDEAHKSAVATLAGDQQFIRDAAVFLVFVADWARAAGVARHRGAPTEGIDFFDSTLTASLDAAIAAQNAIVAAQALGLGAVFVGAVRNRVAELSALLELPAASFPVVGVAIGVPSVHDRSQVKPRLPQSVVRHDERYAIPHPDEIDAYEQTLRAFYAGQGRDAGWLDSVVARVEGASSLHGREGLRATLVERDLPSV